MVNDINSKYNLIKKIISISSFTSSSSIKNNCKMNYNDSSLHTSITRPIEMRGKKYLSKVKLEKKGRYFSFSFWKKRKGTVLLRRSSVCAFKAPPGWSWKYEMENVPRGSLYSRCYCFCILEELALSVLGCYLPRWTKKGC